MDLNIGEIAARAAEAAVKEELEKQEAAKVKKALQAKREAAQALCPLINRVPHPMDLLYLGDEELIPSRPLRAALQPALTASSTSGLLAAARRRPRRHNSFAREINVVLQTSRPAARASATSTCNFLEARRIHL